MICPTCNRMMRTAGLRRWRCWWCQSYHDEDALPAATERVDTEMGEVEAVTAYYAAVESASEEAALRRLSRGLPALFEDTP